MPPAARAAVAAYPHSVAALQQGVAAETRAHQRYVLFGRLAREAGYEGIAYLYTALATSELIHAENYRRILGELGVPVREPEPAAPPVGDTKANLIYAAERELHSIETTYPKILAMLQPENHDRALQAVHYSWASHKQHLDIINKIRKWSPSFFEKVAKRIDENTDHYYVCEICGSTVVELPEEPCPVCNQGPSHYRLIEPGAFA
jgi:rubrerythrin